MGELFNGTILIADLAEGSTEELALEEEVIQEHLGGMGINLYLYEKYSDKEPLIIGTGPLTASFVPGSCLSVMTAKSPLNCGLCHVPLTWQTGVELKLTGFDFLVVLGSSENPVRLWLHDQLAEIEDASEQWGLDVWQTVDALRRNYADDMVQVLTIGAAGERGSSLAQVSENYWGGRDRSALGAIMGQKNLKAIALRGLGSFDVADGFFLEATQLTKRLRHGSLKERAGIKELCPPLGIGQEVVKAIESMTHRHNACFNCPYPCYTFLKYREAPTVLTWQGEEEPGILLSDLAGFVSFHALLGQEAARAMEKAHRLGLEPLACSSLLKKEGRRDIDGALEALAGGGKSLAEAGLPNFYGSAPWPMENKMESALTQALGIFSSGPPPRLLSPSFEKGEPWEKAKVWLERQGLAHVLGICPILCLMCEELTEEALANLLQMTAEGSSFDAERLKSIVKKGIAQSLDHQKDKKGSIHPSLQLDGLEQAMKKLREAFS